MINKLINNSPLDVFNRCARSKHLNIYYYLKKRVLENYKQQLLQTTGWRKYWIKLKIVFIIERQYMLILFSKK